LQGSPYSIAAQPPLAPPRYKILRAINNHMADYVELPSTNRIPVDSTQEIELKTENTAYALGYNKILGFWVKSECASVSANP